MKVAFDSRPAGISDGIGRYTRSLLSALRELAPEDVLEKCDPRGCDVFHSPWIDGALLRSPVPMIVTLHDLIPLRRRGEYLRTGLRFKLRYLAVQRAVRVIVPTEAVAHEAVQMLGIPDERVAAIPEAAAPAFYPREEPEVKAVRERLGLPDEYLLCVGGLRARDPRKRISALAQAERNLPLVLVGQTGRWARELPNVSLTGEVDDTELAALYTGARALICASDDEGFGLPPLEALACGTPVAASDIPAVREVLEGRVELTPVGDLDALIAAAEVARRPAPSPPSWSWQDAAARTWEVYEEAARAPARWRSGEGRRGLRRPTPPV